MIIERIPALSLLTAAEKLQLVGELWDELAANPAQIPVSPEHIAELKRRRDEYRRDPSRATTWESIKERIHGKTHGGA